jgi:hypothetical protein
MVSASPATALEAVAISEGQRNSVAECVEQIVFPFALFVTNPETLYLVEKVIPRLGLVRQDLVEGVLGIFDLPAVDVA